MILLYQTGNTRAIAVAPVRAILKRLRRSHMVRTYGRRRRHRRRHHPPSLLRGRRRAKVAVVAAASFAAARDNLGSGLSVGL